MVGNRTVSNTERQPDPVPICPYLCICLTEMKIFWRCICPSVLLTYDMVSSEKLNCPRNLAEERQSLEPEPAKGRLSFWEEIYNCSFSSTGEATMGQWWMGPNLDQDYAEMCNSGPLLEP